MKGYSWCSNLNIKAIRSMIMNWEEYLIGTREVINPCKILVGKPKCERDFGVERKLILKGI
jgi:hypothetical protein